MQMQFMDLGSASKISLDGRLDTPGVDQIETRFTAGAVSPGKSAIVDFSAVTFISSMGIRMLIASARSMSLKQARMVIFGVQPLVMQTFENAAIEQIIPVAADEAQAMALLQPA